MAENSFTVRNNTFFAVVYLTELDRWHLGKLKKLFRLMFAARPENEKSIETLREFLPQITTFYKEEGPQSQHVRWLKIQNLFESERTK